MTTEELCAELACPPETPAGGLLAAWERRRAELDAVLVDGTHPRPVKLRLREELRRLGEAESLAASLRLAADAEALLAEFGREAAKPRPSPAVLRLCLEKAKPLTTQIADAALAFACERRLAECEDALKLCADPAQAAPKPPRLAEPAAHVSGGHVEAAPLAGAEAASPPLQPPMRRRDAASTPASSAATGRVLLLTPRLAGETLRDPRFRYRIVAKDTFSIGRQSTADCALRYALDTEENRHRLSTISRIHTTLIARGGQIFVRDGEGESRPSRNGTIIDEQRIAETLPLNFGKERRLILGQFGFEVRAQYFSEGFVRFLPAASADRSTLALWLLTAVTVGSSPTAGLRLDATHPPQVARILCRNNPQGATFSLEVQKNHLSHVALDGAPCPPGATVVLQDAQCLQLGNVAFSIGFA